VPKHRILLEKEKSTVLTKFNISVFQLPIIKLNDPVAKALDAKEGDVIEIIRKGPSGTYKYFRRAAK